MKNILWTLGILVLLGLGFLTIIKTPTSPFSQQVLTTLNIEVPAISSGTTSSGDRIDLRNCSSYFDGCNTCFVDNGAIGACTKMFCETPSTPVCLEYKDAEAIATRLDLSTCASYFDGCNTCTVKDGLPDVCSDMLCETPSEPKCLEFVEETIPSTPSTLATGSVAIMQASGFTFSDTELGISFSYPNSWGAITKEFEVNAEGKKSLYTLLHAGNIFLALTTGDPLVARGSFWGDEAKAINSTEYITTFCTNKLNCTIETNPHGIVYAKYYKEETEIGSKGITTRLSYYLFNPNSVFRGIILSHIPDPELKIIIESIQL